MAALQTKGNSITMETAASMIGMLHKATPSMCARRHWPMPNDSGTWNPWPEDEEITKRCPRGGALGRN